MKFKVGDRVRRVRDYHFNMEKGDTGIIENISYGEYLGCINGVDVRLDKNNDLVCGNDEINLELIEGENEMTKDDLENGDIIFLRNGNELIVYNDNELCDLESDCFSPLNNLEDLEEDLIYEDDEDYDVVEVKRPSGYDTMFERKEEVKEMTVSEISKKLGYEVKIVKEK